VSPLQGVYRRLNQRIGHHQLDFPLAESLKLAALTNKRLAAGQRAKLSFPWRLPAATVVAANPATTCGKDSCLDCLQMAFRYEETQLVDGRLPSCPLLRR